MDKVTKALAFSLIELLVVIAIVAVLAAIASPLYKSYTINAKVQGVVKIIDNLVEQSLTFQAQHGRFASAYDLGLSTINGDPYIRNPKNLSEYLQDFSSGSFNSFMGDSSSSNGLGFNCGATGFVQLVLDSEALGFDPSYVFTGTNGNLGIDCEFWNYHGTIIKDCSYWAGTDAASVTDNLFAGLYNENATTNWDYQVFQDSLTSKNYQLAQCSA